MSIVGSMSEFILDPAIGQNWNSALFVKSMEPNEGGGNRSLVLQSFPPFSERVLGTGVQPLNSNPISNPNDGTSSNLQLQSLG